MELLKLMKERRSIRKYTGEQISAADLQTIIEAGLYAPNAGGGQRTQIVAIRNAELVEKIGRLNVACMRRDNLAGAYVSKEQPSIIDDPTIKSGFYGAPALCILFGPRRFLYSVPDTFCAATQMTLQAHSLGLASCIIARGEDTFDNPDGQRLLAQWGIPDTMTARCFVILGHCRGDYPQPKPRREGRVLIVEE